MTAQLSIRDILASLQTNEDQDHAFIVAAAINLYSEANRRLNGRVLFAPNDVRNLFSVLQILFASPADEKPILEGRSRELTAEEQDEVMKSLDKAIKS